MRKLRFKTIFSRLLFLQIATLLAAIIIVGAVLITVVHVQRIQDTKSMLLEKAQSLTAVLLSAKEDFPSEAQMIAKEHDVCVMVIDAQNQVYAYRYDEKWEELASRPLTESKYEDVRSTASFHGDSVKRFYRGLSFPTLTVYCLADAEGEDALVLLHYDLSDCVKSIKEQALWALLICLCAILAAFIVSYYSAYRVVNPFVEINHTVQCYSRGDFSKRIEIQGKDEAAQLGNSFNEMAEQLKNLEETRRSFVANVSHELRSPLTSMKGFLEAMQDGAVPEEKREETLDVVLNETRRMTAMVNDLLDLAKIESGTITLHYETFDINELIRRILITFDARFTEKRMDMEVRFASEQCFVYADSIQIGQVLRNLIDNAIKYSTAGSSVFVSTYSVRREVFVVVRDHGAGIPQEDVPFIFDRFYKVEKAHTPSPQIGSGLGLSIVKRIIEQHGQSITVRSARGKGTQFTFTLQKASVMKRVTDGGKRNGTQNDSVPM